VELPDTVTPAATRNPGVSETAEIPKKVAEAENLQQNVFLPHDAAAKPETASGTVILATTGDEIERLSSTGRESLADVGAASEASNDLVTLARSAKGHSASADSNLLEEVEQQIPTVESLRRREKERAHATRGRRAPLPPSPGKQTVVGAEEMPPAVARSDPREQAAAPPEDVHEEPEQPAQGLSLKDLGPGLLAGMAGNDGAAVTSYSVTGATTGYSQLWLLLLATPLYQAVQYSCACIGRITQLGLAEVLRVHFGMRVAVPATVILVVANVALITGDLVAVGSGFELITGLNWLLFVVPVAAFLWYVTVFQNFTVINRIFLALSLAFIAYLIAGVVSHADWGQVVKDTFVPQIGLSFASISSAVALLGATVSPYTMFWQVQGEKEERRPGTKKQQLRQAAFDIGSGTISGNLVAYFIIVCTSATLFAQHQQITTAADAARALAPLVGPLAKYFFAIGLIGAGLVAIPVLLASTSYAVAGTFSWSASLWKKPWQNEGFYLILTVALVLSVALALLRINPIQLMFGANVLQGILSPVIVVFLLLAGNNRRVMGRYQLGLWTNIGLVLIALLMFAATLLLFYGLATGRSG
jgi:NRAMP (natural resistance-associated macrophage protein)-like metal ion transporter